MKTKLTKLKEYRECHVSNCSNRVHTGGYICTTHQYRKKIHNSWDLPCHKGPPSTLNIEIPPEWSVGKCKVHGYLKEDEMYRSHTYKNEVRYKVKGCRRCVLDRNIKKNYGLKGGLDEYERLIEEQGHACGICGENKISTSPNKNTKRQLSIDHCHVTGKFRGIICTFCNSGLGYFKDSITSLEAAIAYLKKHKTKQPIADSPSCPSIA